MDSNQWDKAREAYELHKLEQIPQVSPWELGPSNRLAIFPGLIGAMALDLELCCSSYRHVQEITGDLSPYEKLLLWSNLSPELVAKVRRLKAQSTAQTFVQNVARKHTKQAAKPKAKARATAAAGRF